MTTPCFIANWKMNKTHREAEAFLRDFDRLSKQSAADPAEVVVAAPFTALSDAAKTLAAIQSDIALAAQNVHNEKAGSFTGEISAGMLRAIGCRYVLVGHSERRRIFGESNAVVHHKLVAARTAGLCPIFCIGESADERDRGQTWAVLEKQLSEGLGNAGSHPIKDMLSDAFVAYEPVWAIGTGQTPRPAEVGEIHKQVNDFLVQHLEGERPRILYGGSISEKNIEAFLKEEAIDGALVGGASLSAATFYTIVTLGARAKKQGAAVANSRK